MLKIDTLKSNPLLAGLTEEQLQTIATMSERDEATVIGARFRETYNQLDETILNATGINRNGDEKTYLYLERAMKEALAKFADYDDLKTRAEKGDPEAVRQLNQAKADLEAMRGQYNTLKAEYDAKKGEFEKSLFDFKVGSVLESARAGLKFKSDANQQIVDLAVKSAMDKIKGYKPSFEGDKLVFHNEDGTTMNNAKNQLLPFTASELLSKELETFGILDDGRRRTGTGGNKPIVKTGAYASQAEATKGIAEDLKARGLVYGTLDYIEAQDKAMAECNFASLPLE